MTVKELKKLLENVDDNNINVEIISPCWGSSMDVFQAYIDKNEKIFFISK